MAKKLVLTVGVFLLTVGCGESRADLFAGFEKCYERYVSPLDRKIEDATALGNYLDGLPSGQQLSRSDVWGIIDTFNLDVSIGFDTNVTGSAARWADGIWQLVLPKLWQESTEQYESCDRIYADRF